MEALERGYAEAGWVGSRKRLAHVWAACFGKPGGIPARSLATSYLFAWDQDRAIEWLEKAYEERDPNMPCLGLPAYDSLRPDPRFQSLLRRMNLPH